MTAPLIEVRVEKRLGETRIAADFTAGAGVTALFGPSGIGKTSVLDMVAGLSRPDAGRIAVDGETWFDAAAGADLPPEARRVGYVFQDRRLFPHLDVRANLLFGRHRGGLADFDRIVALLGLERLLGRWPARLSGGEAQRVAIGRALLSGPKLLLLDEPLSHLDRPRAAEILDLVARLRDEMALPILYVTHEPAEIERLAARRIDL
jgi:molybdate transport system ATP-binding protein